MDNKVIIRKGGHADLEALAAMRLEFLKEAGHVKDGDDAIELYNEIHEAFETRLNKDLYLWLAEINSNAAGTGAVCIWDKLPTYSEKGKSTKIGYVLNMYTRPEYR